MTKLNRVYPTSLFVGIRTKLLISFSLLFSIVFACSYYWLYRSTAWQVVEHIRLELEQLTTDIAEHALDHPGALEYPPRLPDQAREIQRLYQAIQQTDLLSQHRYHYRIWAVVPSGSLQVDACQLVLLLDYNQSRPVARAPLAPVACSSEQQTMVRSRLLNTNRVQVQDQNGILAAYIFLRQADQNVYALLEVDADTAHLKQLQTNINRDFSAAFLICYVVLFVLVYGLATVLSRPLVRLREYAEGIGEGLYDPPVRVEPQYQFPDEISTLAAVLQKMADKVRDRTQHLQTLQKRQERMLDLLRESEAKLHTIVQSASDGILILDGDGRIKFANAAASALFNRTPDELMMHNLGIPITSGTATEIEIPTKEGDVRIGEMKVASTLWEGESVYVASIRDVSDRKQAQKRLLHNALHDQLTQLPNRTYLLYQLKRIVQHLQQAQTALAALLFIDLDEFKVVNDSLGHVVGDRLLIEIGKRLSHAVSDQCFVARLGGDEFAILVYPLHSLSEVYAIAEHVLTDLRCPLHIPHHEPDLRIGASIGIALTPNPATQKAYTHPLEMLRDADTAMYCAKKSGKNRYELFTWQMYVNARTRLSLETALRQAVERGTLSLCYQPIFNLETGQLRSFEALARWHYDPQGWISPSEFIPLAEETGLIVPLGRWVLETACWQLRQWQQRQMVASTVMMSVNLAGKQFLQPTLTDEICSILDRAGLKMDNLLLEITESAIGTNLEQVTNILNRLKNRGVHIAIDDFGTGYSSLSRLHQLPVDCLKIDQSFIARMTESQENQEFVQAIVRFAQVLHIDVVAEGIEIREQENILKQMNCNYGQGYLYAKPLNSEQAGLLLQRLMIDGYSSDSAANN